MTVLPYTRITKNYLTLCKQNVAMNELNILKFVLLYIIHEKKVENVCKCIIKKYSKYLR